MSDAKMAMLREQLQRVTRERDQLRDRCATLLAEPERRCDGCAWYHEFKHGFDCDHYPFVSVSDTDLPTADFYCKFWEPDQPAA